MFVKSFRSHLTLWGLILMLMVLPLGCSPGSTKEDTALSGQSPMGEIAFVVVDLKAAEFAELAKSNVGKWYEEKFKQRGLHSITDDKYSYLLISAGEKSTGGYNVINIQVIGKEEQIEVNADLHEPAPDAAVSQALTYPNVLIRIPIDTRDLSFNGWKLESSPTTFNDFETDSGRYAGQIDANSIEIKISGVPDQLSARAFQLSEQLKTRISNLKLKPEEPIKFYYVEKENQNPVIIDIVKMN